MMLGGRLVSLSAILLVLLLQNDAAMAADVEVGVGGEVTEQQQEQKNETRTWPHTNFTVTEFVVAGYNLADYVGPSTVQKMDEDAALFELFENFDISDLVTGNENWDEMITHRQRLERPSLCFYIDKVARKRWLPVMGYKQPKPYALVYANDFKGTEEEVLTAFQQLLPSETDYVAKPSHMSSTKGTWITSHDKESGKTRFSQIAMVLSDDKDPEQMTNAVARSITQNFKEGPHDFESWLLKNVNPGAIVEERYTDLTNEDAPPVEFNVFTIWGKMWTGQYNFVSNQNRWCGGFFYRNGTASVGSARSLPTWIDWPRVVEIAEELGANKDMFRTDIFVGVPAGVKSGKTSGERRKAVKYAVSECELYPTTVFHDAGLSEEAARLWIAGYKTGIYRTIPNTEVPQEFIDTGGYLSADWDTRL